MTKEQAIENLEEIIELAKDEINQNDKNITATLDLTDLKSCNLFTDEIGHFFLKIVCLWYTSIIHFR